MERESPQLLLTSTAHRRATSLMRKRLGTALAVDDGETLLLLWAAPATADPASPAVWRDASPHWSDDRKKMISAKYLAAVAGQEDAEADDPDPFQGFLAQYLNVWRLGQRTIAHGNPVIEEDAWADLVTPLPDGKPAAVAVESWFSQGVSVVAAWRTDDGVVVSAEDYPDLASAAVRAAAWSAGGKVFVGASISEDPVWAKVRVTPAKGTTKAAVDDLTRMLNDGVVVHDGGEHLTDQVISLRTVPGQDGPRLRSTGRADAVKALVWVVASVRRRATGRPRILLPNP
jgi:ketosteroid isomerase-like protein